MEIIPHRNFFPHNTMGVSGLSLRDLYPSLTRKWYNVAPVDLTKDGQYTFPLVASNMYLVGEVTVTVAGDEVTVAYVTVNDKDSFIVEDETLMLFTSVDQITADFLNAPASDMAFGVPVSRSADLNNADTALLFVCNHVSYAVPFWNGLILQRYWPGTMTEYMNGLKAQFEAFK